MWTLLARELGTTPERNSHELPAGAPSWELSSAVTACPYCGIEFTFWTRKVRLDSTSHIPTWPLSCIEQQTNRSLSPSKRSSGVPRLFDYISITLAYHSSLLIFT
jgi:hypothetical protein